MTEPTERLPDLVARLYRNAADLEALFPGRRFTPDGHLVGNIGEVLAAHLFDLELAPPSTTGFDARTRDGRTVEIKVTQRRTITLRGEEPAAELLVALGLADDGTAEVIYAGPARTVWDAAGPMASNGQRRVVQVRGSASACGEHGDDHGEHQTSHHSSFLLPTGKTPCHP